MTSHASADDPPAALGVRPTTLRLVRPGLAADVVAPSGDTLTPRRRRRAAATPTSWVHAMQPASEHGGDLAAAVAASRVAVDRLVADGVFDPVRGPRFVWYRLTVDDHTQTGLVAEVPVSAYAAGRVLRHEDTRVERVEALAAYRRGVRVASSPVALGHPPVDGLRALARAAAGRAPAVQLHTPDGVGHTLWSVDDEEEVAAVRAAAEAVTRAWILDGHHRMAAAAAVAEHAPAGGPTDHVMAVLFGFDELRVLPFHRVVHLGPTADPRALLERVGRLSPLAPDVDPTTLRGDGDWAVCVAGSWYRLALADPAGAPPADPACGPPADPGCGPPADPACGPSADPACGPPADPACGPPADPACGPAADDLDVVTLQQRVLAPALGVTEPRTDRRLDHLAGGIEELARVCAAAGTVGFVVRPVPPERLVEVARTDVILPPKSTRFDPKVRSGLLLRHLE